MPSLAAQVSRSMPCWHDMRSSDREQQWKGSSGLCVAASSSLQHSVHSLVHPSAAVQWTVTTGRGPVPRDVHPASPLWAYLRGNAWQHRLVTSGTTATGTPRCLPCRASRAWVQPELLRQPRCTAAGSMARPSDTTDVVARRPRPLCDVGCRWRPLGRNRPHHHSVPSSLNKSV